MTAQEFILNEDLDFYSGHPRDSYYYSEGDMIRFAIPDVMVSVCSCSKGKGIDHDENGKAYCIDCGKFIEQTEP